MKKSKIIQTLGLNLIFKSQIVAKLPDKEYGETEFSFRDIYYHSQYYEDTNEDDLGEILNAAVDEVKSNIEEDQDNDSIMEYKHFILNQ